MYERSRKMLIFLVVIFLAFQIALGVITAMLNRSASGGKLQSYIEELSTSDSPDEYQRSMSSLAPICAFTTFRTLKSI
jgi:hypothetical protein